MGKLYIFSLFQALWLSENQAKPMLAFQTDYDDATGDQAGLSLSILSISYQKLNIENLSLNCLFRILCYLSPVI
jgi:hypothetical protein